MCKSGLLQGSAPAPVPAPAPKDNPKVEGILPDEGEKCSEYEVEGYNCVNRDLCKKCKQNDENCFTERFEAAGNPEEATCYDKNQICCFSDEIVEPGIN